MAYTLPRVDLNQQFAAVPEFTDNPLAACIVGPKFSVSDEISNGTATAQKYTAGSALSISLINNSIATADVDVALSGVYAKYFPLTAFNAGGDANAKFNTYAGQLSAVEWDTDNVIDNGALFPRSSYFGVDVQVGDLLTIESAEYFVDSIHPAGAGSASALRGMLGTGIVVPFSAWYNSISFTTGTAQPFWPYLYGGASTTDVSVLDTPLIFEFTDSHGNMSQGHGLYSMNPSSLVVVPGYDSAGTSAWKFGTTAIGEIATKALVPADIVNGTELYLVLGDNTDGSSQSIFVRPFIYALSKVASVGGFTAANLASLLGTMDAIAAGSAITTSTLAYIITNATGYGATHVSVENGLYLKPSVPAKTATATGGALVSALSAYPKVNSYFIWKTSTYTYSIAGPQFYVCRDHQGDTGNGRLGYGWTTTSVSCGLPIFSLALSGSYLTGVNPAIHPFNGGILAMHTQDPAFTVKAYPYGSPASAQYGIEGADYTLPLSVLTVDATDIMHESSITVDIEQLAFDVLNSSLTAPFYTSIAGFNAFFNNKATFYRGVFPTSTSSCLATVTKAGSIIETVGTVLPFTTEAYKTTSGIKIAADSTVHTIAPGRKYAVDVDVTGVKYNVLRLTTSAGVAITDKTGYLYRNFARKDLVKTTDFSAAAGNLQVKASISVTDADFVANSVLVSLPVYTGSTTAVKAEVLYQYRIFDNATANILGSVTGTFDALAIETALGGITSSNPLGLGVWIAKYNAGTAPVYYMPIASNDEAGYTAALAALVKTKLPYSLVPLTQTTAVTDLFKEHVDTMSSAEYAAWRRVYLSTDIATGGSEAANATTTAAQVASVGSMAANNDREELVSVCVGPFTIRGEAGCAGYYGACAAAGSRSGVAPHQPLTNSGVNGIDDVSWSYDSFNQDHLNEIAEAGAYLIVQDSATDTPYVRHQITANYSATDVNRREESVVTNAHFLNYAFKACLDPFIGKYNRNPVNIQLMKDTLENTITYYMGPDVSTATAGAQVLGYEIKKFEPHATLKDKVTVVLSTVLPGPINNVEMTHEVQ